MEASAEKAEFSWHLARMARCRAVLVLRLFLGRNTRTKVAELRLAEGFVTLLKFECGSVGIRKRGFSIERAREGEASVYRIVGTMSAAAA